MQSLARNIATEAPNAKIAADVGGSDGPLAKETIAEYLGLLDRLMVTDNLPAWNTHIRSRARLRKAPKRHFADTSFASMALGLRAEALLHDLEFMGLLFESAVIHDLRVYAEQFRGRLYQYRDSNGLEADAIIEAPDGSWAAVEIKLGFGAVDAAAKTLTDLAATVDTTKVGQPKGLLVVTGAGFAHRRPDGVAVIPLNTLTA
jgi:predicted AAA+ superfamily ATPase